MSNISKRHIYKVYREGSFLGLLGPVTSEFGYSQDVNTAGTQIQVAVELSADNSREAIEAILAETGLAILTEAEAEILIERSPDAVGSGNPSNLIQNGNDLEVWEVSKWHPDGIQVFDGYISKWRATFGRDDNVIITALSNGAELDNYLAQSNAVLDVSQTSQNSYSFIYELSMDLPGPGVIPSSINWQRLGQTFTTGSGVVNVSSIVVKLGTTPDGGPQNVTLKLWASVAAANAGGTPMGSVTQYVDAVALTDYTFTFATPVEVTQSTQYFFTLQGAVLALSSTLMNVGYQNTNIYAGGDMYVNAYGGGSGGGSWYITPYGANVTTLSDLYFKTYWTTGATRDPHANQDPSDIVRTVVDSYISRGGHIGYTDDSIDDTGTLVSYTFRLNTIFEALQKARSLAPPNWYFFVDPGDSTLYFKGQSLIADHTLVLGEHIEYLDLEATIEQIKNVVYFTGGDTGGGENLFLLVTDADSVVNNKVGLARISDTNVTDAGVGTTIAEAYQEENSEEQYITTVSILDAMIDTNLFKPGQVIGFAGFGSFVDNLLLPIVRKKKESDRVELGLGLLPRREAVKLDDTERAVTELQTVDNPDEPS